MVKECSLISSVSILSFFIHNIYLSFHTAFSFYHTAYKERIDTVEQTLDVVEKLREYRPKQAAHKSATRTPVFSSMGFSALSNKQHFNILDGALRNSTHQPLPSRENSNDSDADNKMDRSTRRIDAKYSKSPRFSWLGSPPDSPSPSRKESDSLMEVHEKMRSVENDIELGPISEHSLDTPTSQVHLNPKEHSTANNLITSPGHGLDNNHPDTILKQATRVLKNTVLHDARNLSGQGERLAGWNVSSAHEAKVRHSTCIQSGNNSPHIGPSASCTLHLPATERPRKDMANSC